MFVESIIAGIAGGFVGTVVMMGLLQSSVCFRPTIIEDVLKQYTSVDDEFAGNVDVRRAVQVVYGSAAGGVLGSAAPLFADDASIGAWIAIGLMYALVLFVINNKIWINAVLGGSSVQDMPVSYLLVLTVYGIVTGGIIGVLTLG